MKILDNIKLIDLGIYVNDCLIFSDFHIGYEESLNKKGILLPRFQFTEIIKRLDKIFLKVKKVDKIIVNGDLKHEFGKISEQEWRHTLKLLDYFSKYCNEVILIKGNHDKHISPIENKRKVKIVDYCIIEPIKKENANKKVSNKEKAIKKETIIKKTLKIDKKIISKNIKKSNILVMHGDKLPKKELLRGISTIIIGHEHPAVSIREGNRAENFKSYLIGKWKRKNLIAQPSFNLVTKGTDILKEKLLSPFLKRNLKDFEAVVVGDKLYNFGKIKELT